MNNKTLGTIIGLCAAATATAILGGGNAQAASFFTIDNFDSFQQVSKGGNNGAIPTPQPLPANLSNQSSYDSAILGGYRDLNLKSVTGTNLNKVAKGIVEDGALSWNNDSSVSSTLEITWDGNDSATTLNKTGLQVSGIGQDLTLNEALNGIFIAVIDEDLKLQITLDVYTNANNWSRITSSEQNYVLVKEGELEGYYFNFADFIVKAGEGADFSNVGAMQMTLTGPTSIDADVQFVQASVPPVKTPESNLSWLVLAGVTVMGALYTQDKVKLRKS